MRVFSRIGLVSAVAFAGLLAPVDGRQPGETSTPALVAAADGKPLTIRDGAGRYLALHFLAGTDAECAAFAREYLAGRDAVAGVRHVFIHPGEATQAKPWAAGFGDDAASVFTDPGHALARSLGIASEGHGRSATIVLDPMGKEVFRHVGASHEDHLTFADFARRLGRASRRSTIDDYNLPRNRPLAVEGYDVVAYHRLNRAVKGVPSLASSYRGITYHFSTPEHRGLFAANPEKYLPTYGGWCASAMGAKGTKVEINPGSFKIKDGRLHLFYKSAFGDALKDWNQHEREWEVAADANWKKLTGEDPVTPAP